MSRTSVTDAHRCRSAVLDWYDAHGRDLPWRETRDPYAILVSEVMLQQTQVSRVVTYWPAFLDRFPSAEALASASLDDVLSAWSGLGYYGRARRLRAAAVQIVAEHGGVVPESPEALRRLPGIGKYTAAAVSSIAFNLPEPVLDANVVRVVARLLAFREDASGAAGRRVLAAAAAGLLEPGRPGDSNQALMDLGATVCTPESPSCSSCPALPYCAAAAAGHPERFPSPARRGATVETFEAVAVVARRGKVLLGKPGHERGWWEGLWIPPRSPIDRVEEAAERLAGALASIGLSGVLVPWGKTIRYTVTRHRVSTRVFALESPRGALRKSSGWRWFSSEDLAGLALPAPYLRALSDRIGQLPLPGGR